jgi:hypothetical protein
MSRNVKPSIPKQDLRHSEAYNLVERLREVEDHADVGCAEAADTIEELVEMLDLSTDICARYADYVRDMCRADDLELHPYLPSIDGQVADNRALLAKVGGEIDCPACGGSGFSGHGTGYGDVCGQCGGTKHLAKLNGAS